MKQSPILNEYPHLIQKEVKSTYKKGGVFECYYELYDFMSDEITEDGVTVDWSDMDGDIIKADDVIALWDEMRSLGDYLTMIAETIWSCESTYDDSKEVQTIALKNCLVVLKLKEDSAEMKLVDDNGVVLKREYEEYK
jgi:hypothetical protein